MITETPVPTSVRLLQSVAALELTASTVLATVTGTVAIRAARRIGRLSHGDADPFLDAQYLAIGAGVAAAFFLVVALGLAAGLVRSLRSRGRKGRASLVSAQALVALVLLYGTRSSGLALSLGCAAGFLVCVAAGVLGLAHLLVSRPTRTSRWARHG